MAVTLGLIKMAIESNGDIKKFYELIDKYSKMVFEIHEWTYERLAQVKGYTDPLLFTQGGAIKSVGYNDTIEPLLESSTASLGFLGIEEACQALFKSGIKENHKFALELVKHLRELCDNATKEYNHLYALYATPAESLVYKTALKIREQYGYIKNVNSRDYVTNSFHIPVWEEIDCINKIKLEEEFHKYASGGRITYTEFPNAVDENVLRSVIDFAMEKGLYFGVNIVSSHCNDCNFDGEFEICPVCGSENTTSVTRACGYLSYDRLEGETRYNEGKQQEIHERVKHEK